MCSFMRFEEIQTQNSFENVPKERENSVVWRAIYGATLNEMNEFFATNWIR